MKLLHQSVIVILLSTGISPGVYAGEVYKTVDKDGNVVYSHTGYRKGDEKKVEKKFPKT